MSDLITFALPFLFVLAVVYGALEVGGIFKNARVNALIAFVLAFLSITSQPVITFIFQVLPYAAILFIIVFLLGFILSPFRGEKKGQGPDYSLIIIVAGLVLIFASQQYEAIATLLPFASAESFIGMAGVILVIVILYAAYRMKSE